MGNPYPKIRMSKLRGRYYVAKNAHAHSQFDVVNRPVTPVIINFCYALEQL